MNSNDTNCKDAARKAMMGKRLQALYGSAPDAYKETMSRTFGQMEEEPKMKRISGVVLAFVLILALAGAALAAHQLGTFDFLFPGREVPEDIQEQRQGNLRWQGGDFETVDCTVLDAVSDGISAFMAVQFKAKHAEDLLFSEFDKQAYARIDEDVDAAAIQGRRLVVWQNWDMGEGLYLSGWHWQQIDPQTVILHYIIDLSTCDDANEVILRFSPGIRLANGTDMPKDLEQEEVQVALQTSVLERAEQKVKALPDGNALGITFTAIDRTITPLATYLRLTYHVNDPSEEATMDWQDIYGSLWFKLQDEEGRAYGLLNGGGKYSDDAAEVYEEEVRQMYEHMDASMDTVTLIPYISGTETVLDPITVVFE